jgi:hypothetical protein
MGDVSHLVFYFSLGVAVVALVASVRVLYLAWSDYRFRRERRLGEDRRRQSLAVPMERRKTDRRT